jgi:uncharacterized MAPEG superfamily protein
MIVPIYFMIKVAPPALKKFTPRFCALYHNLPLMQVLLSIPNPKIKTKKTHKPQLGNKITKGVSNQLKNQAINKTEGFVNNKANTFLNAFGAGRSEVSIGGLSWIFLLVRLTKI